MTPAKKLIGLINDLDGKHQRLLACDFAERTFPFYNAINTGDDTLEECIKVARAFANGTTKAGKLIDARNAVRSIVRTDKQNEKANDHARNAASLAALSVMHAVAYCLSQGSVMEVARAASSAAGEAACNVKRKDKAIADAGRIQAAIAGAMVRHQHDERE